MTEVRFYHLTRGSLESSLPVMLERTLARGQRAVVQCGSDDRAETLANHLWTYSETSFLPHGTARDGRPQAQPVWLTGEDEQSPNDAQVLFLTAGAKSDRVAEYGLCAILFDGGDAAAVEAARSQWRDLKAEGHDLTYWQQDERGRWAQKEL
jgi:DNA polymerase-3 subunit chi